MSQAPFGRQPFTEQALQDFLKSGWMLSLPSLGSKQVLVGWGDLRADSQMAVRPGEASLFAPDFHLQASQPWCRTPYWDLLDRDGFTSLVMSPVAHNVNDDDQGFQWVEPDEGEFFQRFNGLQQKMKTGRLQKAVPVVFAEASGRVSVARKLKILQNLSRLPLTLFIYGVWGQENGKAFGMLGATPELLFSEMSENCLETVAVAGTRGKSDGANPARALFEDPKERHEHQLVIDDIKSVLAQVGDVETDATGVVELPSLFHLKTSMRAKLKGAFGIEEMAKLLHPTPALGVAPRALGFEEIRTWDDVAIRGRYGAPFGVEVDLDGRKIRECVVAIRNIQWQDTVIRLGSGCGVVPESDPAREWRELKLKRESVKRMLGV